jgi:hypothetical protein
VISFLGQYVAVSGEVGRTRCWTPSTSRARWAAGRPASSRGSSTRATTGTCRWGRC